MHLIGFVTRAYRMDPWILFLRGRNLKSLVQLLNVAKPSMRAVVIGKIVVVASVVAGGAVEGVVLVVDTMMVGIVEMSGGETATDRDMTMTREVVVVEVVVGMVPTGLIVALRTRLPGIISQQALQPHTTNLPLLHLFLKQVAWMIA